jgi:hypothetical protein
MKQLLAVIVLAMVAIVCGAHVLRASIADTLLLASTPLIAIFLLTILVLLRVIK